jgi:hypothetical protein
MRILLTFTALMLAMPCAATPALSQSIQGVWKLTEIVVGSGANAGRHTTDVQPGLAIYTSRHYSLLYVQGFAARSALGDSATAEQSAKVWEAFTANAGTYELKDSTLSYTPSVAKNPEVMSGNTNKIRVRIKADSMWFTVRSGSGVSQGKWVRVERLQTKGARAVCGRPGQR